MRKFSGHIYDYKYDYKRLNELFRHFRNATGMTICFRDTNYMNITEERTISGFLK